MKKFNANTDEIETVSFKEIVDMLVELSDDFLQCAKLADPQKEQLKNITKFLLETGRNEKIDGMILGVICLTLGSELLRNSPQYQMESIEEMMNMSPTAGLPS